MGNVSGKKKIKSAKKEDQILNKNFAGLSCSQTRYRNHAFASDYLRYLNEFFLRACNSNYFGEHSSFFEDFDYYEMMGMWDAKKYVMAVLKKFEHVLLEDDDPDVLEAFQRFEKYRLEKICLEEGMKRYNSPRKRKRVPGMIWDPKIVDFEEIEILKSKFVLFEFPLSCFDNTTRMVENIQCWVERTSFDQNKEIHCFLTYADVFEMKRRRGICVYDYLPSFRVHNHYGFKEDTEFEEFDEFSDEYNLPKDILVKIFSYLTVNDIFSVLSISKAFYTVVQDDSLWENFFYKSNYGWFTDPDEIVSVKSWKHLFRSFHDYKRNAADYLLSLTKVHMRNKIFFHFVDKLERSRSFRKKVLRPLVTKKLRKIKTKKEIRVGRFLPPDRNQAEYLYIVGNNPFDISYLNRIWSVLGIGQRYEKMTWIHYLSFLNKFIQNTIPNFDNFILNGMSRSRDLIQQYKHRTNLNMADQNVLDSLENFDKYISGELDLEEDYYKYISFQSDNIERENIHLVDNVYLAKSKYNRNPLNNNHLIFLFPLSDFSFKNLFERTIQLLRVSISDFASDHEDPKGISVIQPIHVVFTWTDDYENQRKNGSIIYDHLPDFYSAEYFEEYDYQSEFSSTNYYAMSTEIFYEIFKWLEPPHIASLLSVSKLFYNILSDNEIWKHYFHKSPYLDYLEDYHYQEIQNWKSEYRNFFDYKRNAQRYVLSRIPQSHLEYINFYFIGKYDSPSTLQNKIIDPIVYSIKNK